MLVIRRQLVGRLEERRPNSVVDRTAIVELDQQCGQLVVGRHVARGLEHRRFGGRREARTRQRRGQHPVALVIGADRFRRGDETRLHPLGERLRLRDRNQKFGELVIAADRLAGHRDEALVARGVQLAALDRLLVVDPPPVVPGDFSQLGDEPLNAAAVENPASALLGHEAAAPEEQCQRLGKPGASLVVERLDGAIHLVLALESATGAAFNREPPVVSAVIDLDDDPTARSQRGDIGEVIVEAELPVRIEADRAIARRDTDRDNIPIAFVAVARAPCAGPAAPAQCVRSSDPPRRRGR